MKKRISLHMDEDAASLLQDLAPSERKRGTWISELVRTTALAEGKKLPSKVASYTDATYTEHVLNLTCPACGGIMRLWRSPNTWDCLSCFVQFQLLSIRHRPTAKEPEIWWAPIND